MKCVITCGGQGTRMLPFSKELPKEMAPIFTIYKKNLQVKPLIQQIFENLFIEGIRDFCFVTGRSKHAINDHFSPDLSQNPVQSLKDFHDMLKQSSILWVNQLIPKGFGDAVRESHTYVGSDDFLLHAGDVSLLYNKNPIKQLISLSKISSVDGAILLRSVHDPKRHGIASIQQNSDGLQDVLKVIEKPDKPETNLGIMPIYFFRSSIFDALEKTKPGKGNEIQLTDAIQILIEEGKRIIALRIDDYPVFDVGTPEAFYSALNDSYNLCINSIGD